jgi:hypothetical protein
MGSIFVIFTMNELYFFTGGRSTGGGSTCLGVGSGCCFGTGGLGGIGFGSGLLMGGGGIFSIDGFIT